MQVRFWWLLAMGAGAISAVSRGEAKAPHVRPSVPERGSIVLLGASFAAGWRLPDVAGSPVVNRAIDGQHSFDLLARFDRDVVSLQPRAVVIWGHINDIFNAPRDSMDLALARARDSYARMIRKARAADIEVIVASEIFMGRRTGWWEAVRAWLGRLRGKEGYDTYINRHVAALNVWLRDMAAAEDVLFLDLQPVLSDSHGRRLAASCQPDGVHVTPTGYAALTAYAVPVLERHFSGSSDR